MARRQKRTRNSSGAGAKQLEIEPRNCICPLHEGFWVTPGSKQVYALPACRKREHDRIKKVAFRQFMYDGLRRLGVAAKQADEIAYRALKYFYTRYVKLLKQLGWRYSPAQATWVKEAA